jgi:predicted AAA+ superfamily ATPase
MRRTERDFHLLAEFLEISEGEESKVALGHRRDAAEETLSLSDGSLFGLMLVVAGWTIKLGLSTGS